MAMSGSDRYSYTPLDNAGGQVRLLKVAFDVKLAVGHKSTNPLEGSLKSYYLPISTLPRTQRVIRSARLPAFYALSYVWGNPTRTHEILLDGKKLGITENLFKAIQDLQRDAYGEIYLWADAICINQDDQTERSDQVLRMREIYHSAASVRIWLGPSNDDGKKCMRFIADLVGYIYDDTTSKEETTASDDEFEERFVKAVLKPSAVLLNAGYGFGQAGLQILDIISPSTRDDKATLVLDPEGNEKVVKEFSKWRPSNRRLKKVQAEDFGEMAALIDLTFVQNCPWFERMWVVQELGAAETAEIVYDGIAVDWVDFLHVAYYLHYTRKFPLPNIHKLTGLEKIRRGWNDGKRISLLQLVREFQYRRSTDPRDRIFALLGLMGDEMNSLLQPDYRKPVSDVYARATRHFILQSGSLDPICGWQTQGRLDIPSWIPDYSLDQKLAASPLVVNLGHESLFAASEYGDRAKCALNISTIQDCDGLQVTGLCIDSISVHSVSASESEPFGSIERTWNSTILGAGHLLPGLTKALEAALETTSSIVSNYSACWEKDRLTRSYSLHSDSIEKASFTESGSPPSYLDVIISDVHDTYIFDAYLQCLLCGRGTMGKRLTERDVQTILNSKGSVGTSDQPPSDVILAVCTAFERGMKRRNMVVTSKGYIGAVPEQAQQSDLVCILFGCSVPVVLRKRKEENCYSFIGECYLHGFMDAEAIEMHVKKVLNEQNFILI
jgi:hypothetical protein